MKTNTTPLPAMTDIDVANELITKKHRYACGITGEWTEYTGYFRNFFLSPDGQNGELYYQLLQFGYRKHQYTAEYYWAVRKDGVEIEYVEGDLYIRKVECDGVHESVQAILRCPVCKNDPLLE